MSTTSVVVVSLCALVALVAALATARPSAAASIKEVLDALANVLAVITPWGHGDEHETPWASAEEPQAGDR